MNFTTIRGTRGKFWNLKKYFATKVSQNVEQPVIVVNEYDNVDIIGPPNAVSNLRPIIRRNLVNESPLQKRFREMQDATQEWNEHFWSVHNTKFIKERQNYIALNLKDTNEKQLTADEISEFYKKFLDQNWQIHVKYNLEWYKKNFTLLLLALQVTTEKLVLLVLAEAAILRLQLTDARNLDEN